MKKKVIYSVLLVSIVSVLVLSISSFVTERYPAIVGIDGDGDYESWYGESFYALSPELISHGDLFDLKLLLCDANVVNFLRVDTESDENVGCLISVIKKSRGDFAYDVEITTYKDGTMVDVMNVKGLSYQMDFLLNLFSTVGIRYIEAVPLGYVDKTNSLLETKQYDRIQFVFTYYRGGKKVEEVHDLQYDKDHANKLFFETIEEYCTNVGRNSEKKNITMLYVEKYMMSICSSDFELWKENMDLIVNGAKTNGSNSWHLMFLKEFHECLFPEQEISIENDDLEVYENTKVEISNLVSNN